MITLICLYSKELSYIRKYLKTLKNSNVVNYMDISNKLTKNDIYSQEPSSLIINSHIIRVLEKFLLEDKPSTLYYVMSNFEPDTIYNLKKYIESIIPRTEFNFYVKLKNKEDYKNLFFLFDKVEELEF